MLLNIQSLIDDAKCFQTVRDLRWPNGVSCPHCSSPVVTKQGYDETQPHRQRYQCSACQKRFDDLTGTIFAGHHQPLRVWILCLYFMGLNLSNEQIARELDLNSDDVQRMTTQLREGIVVRKPEVVLSGEVECDEVYVVAGHKGHPEEVKNAAVGARAQVECVGQGRSFPARSRPRGWRLLGSKDKRHAGWTPIVPVWRYTMRATDGLQTTITLGPVKNQGQVVSLELSLDLSLPMPSQDEHLPDHIEVYVHQAGLKPSASSSRP